MHPVQPPSIRPWCEVCDNLPFHYCNHMIHCSVQCAIGTRKHETTVYTTLHCSTPYHSHNPTGPFLTHKATTFGGSSGAPLFKVVQGEPVVVALHCGCVPPTGPPQLNGGMLISHILHHIFTGSFKEGRESPLWKASEAKEVLRANPSLQSLHRAMLVGCHVACNCYMGFLLTCADFPPLEEVLKECAPASAEGREGDMQNSGKLVITE